MHRIRETVANVDRWQGGTMVLRWVAAALVEAAKCFRRLRGYKDLPKLVAALRVHDTPRACTVDRVRKAA